MKLLLLLLLFVFSSCSTTIESPPDQIYWESVEATNCIDSSALPVLDNVVGGLLLGWGVVGLAFANPFSLLDIAAGSGLIVSGVSGERKLKGCESLKQHIIARRERKTRGS